ncbi:MAG: FtsX-like permease family protein [Acidimicrobiales bacterium]
MSTPGDRAIRLRILASGIGARRGAAIMLFIVAVIAVTAAAIGPMFLQSADTSVLTSTARATPIGQTDLLMNEAGSTRELAKMKAASRRAQSLAPGLLAPAIFTVDDAGHFAFENSSFQADILARTGLCSHLHFIDGSCPTAPYDVALSERSAKTAHASVGTVFRIGEPTTTRTQVVTVSAIYIQPSSVNTNYWKEYNYFTFGSGTASNIILDPLVTSFRTALKMDSITEPELSADLAWRPSSTLIGPTALASRARLIESTLLHRYDLPVTSGLSSVVSSVQRDDRLMSTVVLAIVLQLMLLSLLIVYSLGRSIVLDRRSESEFARRHGFPRAALIALAVGEPAALILAALPIGLLLAWGTLGVISHTLFESGTPVRFPVSSILTAVGASVAGVIAMTLASLDLWRSRAVGARQARRFSLAIDAVALFLTVTGVVLLSSKDSLSASHGSALTLAAPGILTLGASLLGLRLIALAINVLIARTAESSRVAWFLALRQIGRRPISMRRLLPLTAATAVLLFAVSSFFLASSNRTLVAHFDGGAAEVVNVTPPARVNFEDAVRRADPSGRQAMAVANYSSSTGDLMAVDSSRLARVAYWETSLSRLSLAQLARKISPSIPNGVVFNGTKLRLTLDVAAGTPDIELGVNLYDQTYQASPSTYIGPITSGTHTYTLSLSGCADVCRLISLAPNWKNSNTSYSPSVSFALTGVSVENNGAWRAVPFGAGKKGAWSAEPSSVQIASPAATAVTFDIPGAQLALQGLLLNVVDLPPALPAIVTGGAASSDAPPSPSANGDIDIDLGGGLLPAHPVAIVSTLPLLGSNGVIADYALAERAATSSEDIRTFQVWLTPGASPAILQRLQRDGVMIGTITTTASRLNVLNHAGVALAYAVALLVTPIAGVLAICTVAFIIITDGRRRRRERAALWMAGVPIREVRRAQTLESLVTLSTSLVLGTVIGLLVDELALAKLPQFVNGSGGLQISHSVPFGPFFGSVGLFAGLLVIAVAVSSRLVMHRAKSRHESEVLE